MKIQKKNSIKTERLVLKAFSDSDRDRLVEMFRNEELSQTYMIPSYKTDEEFFRLADRMTELSRPGENSRIVYGIYLGDILIGCINDCGFDDNEIEIGYFIHPDYKNKGYCTEALKAVISELREMGFRRLKAGFFDSNIASRRVMEKCGMKLTDEADEIEYRGVTHRCPYCELEL